MRTAALEALDASEVSAQAREILWRELSKIADHHRSFPDAQWVLPNPIIERLEKVRDRLQPNDAIVVATRLFKHGYHPIGDHRLPWEQQEEMRTNRRLSALNVVIDQQGFHGVLRLVDGADDIRTIGVLVAQSHAAAFERQILPELLCCGAKNRETFATTYVAQRAWTDRPWAEA